MPRPTPKPQLEPMDIHKIVAEAEMAEEYKEEADANLNRYAVETQQQYWNIDPRKLKFRFERKPRPNIYN